MAKNNKYQTNIQQVDSTWQAQIIRQVSSKKTTTTKEQSGFATESEAKEWADSELKSLLATLVSSNKRHGENRKQNLNLAEQRSLRRAEKTALAKAAKIKNTVSGSDTNTTTDGLDPEVDYDFDEFTDDA